MYITKHLLLIGGVTENCQASLNIIFPFQLFNKALKDFKGGVLQLSSLTETTSSEAKNHLSNLITTESGT